MAVCNIFKTETKLKKLRHETIPHCRKTLDPLLRVLFL